MDLAALGKEPISPDQPCGSDTRYDPLFEQLQAEVDRSSLPSVAGAVDWEKVVILATEVLSQKSKDLLVAGYLAVALIHTRQLRGLAVALKVYRDLLECHGSGLFPERQRGRLRSVEWWLEKSEMALEPLNDCSIDPNELVSMQENVEKLGQLLDGLLPEAPSLQVLRGFLQRAAQSPATIDSDRTPPETESPSAPIAEGQEPAQAVVERKMPPPPDNRIAVEECLQPLLETAILLRDRDLGNPLAYRFFRFVCWAGVVDLPPTNAGRTLLSPPSVQLRNQLAELRRGGDSKTLLEAVEGQLGQFIFWLDLNRLAAEALAGLGSVQTAVDAVVEETSFLLQRLPGLDKLAFADGFPFADADTRQWLKRTMLGVEKGAVAHPIRTADLKLELDDARRPGELDAAGTLIGEWELMEGIDRFQARLKDSSSERERLRWRLALSRELMDAEQTKYALPQLEQVITDIANYRLEVYEPALALEGLKLAWRGFRSQAESHFKEKAMDVLQQIGRIDLAEMVRLSQLREVAVSRSLSEESPPSQSQLPTKEVNHEQRSVSCTEGEG